MPRLRHVLAATALALLMTSCAPKKKPYGEMCGANSQCASRICFENLCSKRCTTDSDCGPGRSCMDGTTSYSASVNIAERFCR